MCVLKIKQSPDTSSEGKNQKQHAAMEPRVDCRTIILVKSHADEL